VNENAGYSILADYSVAKLRKKDYKGLFGPQVLVRPWCIHMQGLGSMERPVGIAQHLPPQQYGIGRIFATYPWSQ
jgi:hypothetical protein